MRIDGGDPRTVCDAVSYRGASWGAEYIVFAGGQGPIFKVPVTGGIPEDVTALDESRGETAHRFPYFLPDGETFLYVALPGKHRVLEVYAGHVDGREPVFVTNSLISPVYASGHLIFQRGRRLLAQVFDPDALALSGKPVDLGPAPTLWEGAGATKVSASRNGTLAYLTPEDPSTRLVWKDPTSENSIEDLGTLDLEPGAYKEVEFSPDGHHVALVREVSPEESDIWVLELDRGILTRFTNGPGNHDTVKWSPDGAWIGYSTDADGPWNIYRKPFPGGGAAEPVVTGPVPFKNLLDWSPDGKFLLYSALGVGTNMDLWFAPADGSGEPRPYQAGTFQEDMGQFSPDGRWVAYVSWESGGPNVYIDAFPVPGRKHRVSIDAGWSPSWTPDGTGIQFTTPGRKRFEGDSRGIGHDRCRYPRRGPRSGRTGSRDQARFGGPRCQCDRGPELVPAARQGESLIRNDSRNGLLPLAARGEDDLEPQPASHLHAARRRARGRLRRSPKSGAKLMDFGLARAERGTLRQCDCLGNQRA
jgi:hypothetical protein